MIWADFKAVIEEMMTVDSNRRGTEALKLRSYRNCAVDLQRYIRGYRSGHTTTYQVADLTLKTEAMLGSMPVGAIAQAIYTISTAVVDGELDDPNCRRNRMDFQKWTWESRRTLICGACDCRTYAYAIAPYGNQFLIHPIINDETELKLVWEGLKSNFADGDEVPFPEDAAEAFAAYAKSKILALVDKNHIAAREEKAEYMRLRLALFRDFQEKLDAEKPDQEYVDQVQLPLTLADFGYQDGFLRLVTQLQGLDGDVTALSAIPTIGISVPFEVSVLIGGTLQNWVLQASALATGPGVQRPNDWTAVTNEKCWIIQA